MIRKLRDENNKYLLAQTTITTSSVLIKRDDTEGHVYMSVKFNFNRISGYVKQTNIQGRAYRVVQVVQDTTALKLEGRTYNVPVRKFNLALKSRILRKYYLIQVQIRFGKCIRKTGRKVPRF